MTQRPWLSHKAQEETLLKRELKEKGCPKDATSLADSQSPGRDIAEKVTWSDALV